MKLLTKSLFRAIIILSFLLEINPIPVKANNGLNFINIVANAAELNYCWSDHLCHTLKEDYDNGYKHLAIISGSGGEGVSGGLEFYVDIDDYMGFSTEGYSPIEGEGWVSVWANLTGSMGSSIPPIPIGGGVKIARIIREYGIDDPQNSFSMKVFDASTPFLSISLVDIDSEGKVLSSVSHGENITIPEVNLLSISRNVLRKEYKRKYIDRMSIDAIKDIGIIGVVNPVSIAQNLIAKMFKLSSSGLISLNIFPAAGEERQFTSLDNGSEFSLAGYITSALGGIDITGDKIPDNAFPTSYYWGHLPVHFQALSSNVEDYFVKVVDKPEGWFVWANDNDICINGFNSTYDVKNLPYGSFGETDWLIQRNGGVDKGIIKFELWVKQGLFGSKWLNDVSVDVSRLAATNPSNAPTINPISISSVVSGQPFTISANITSPNPIDNAWLYYFKYPGTNKKIEMNRSSGSLYQSTIPAEDVAGPEIIYYISAISGGAISYTDNFAVPITTPIAIKTVSITSNKTQYLPNEVGILNINLKDSSNNSINGANLIYTLDNNSSVTAFTEVGNGNYQMQFTAPAAVKDYNITVTATKTGFVSGQGVTTITVYQTSDPGHNLRADQISVEIGTHIPNSTFQVTGNIYNGGSNTEQARIAFRLRDPNGNLVNSTPVYSPTFSIAPNNPSINYSVNLTAGSVTGDYQAEMTAEIIGASDYDPSDNTAFASVYVGQTEAFNEFGLSQIYADEGSTTDIAQNHKITINSISSGSANISLLTASGGTISDCKNVTVYRNIIKLCDSNRFAVILNVITSSVPKQAWFYVGQGGAMDNTDITFNPGTAVTPAGLYTYYHVTSTNTNRHFTSSSFDISIRESGDDYDIVKNWLFGASRNNGNYYDYTFKLKPPSDAAVRTNMFWLEFRDDNDSTYDHFIRRLWIDVKPPHDIQITNITPSGTSISEGNTEQIQATLNNNSSYIEKNLSVSLVVTGPNGYSEILNQAVASLNNNSSQVLTWNWPTSGMSAGTYTFQVSSPLTTDAYPANNSLSVSNTLVLPPQLSATITTDKTEYFQAEPILLTTNVTSSGNPVEDASVMYFMKDSGGNIIGSGNLVHSSTGNYSKLIPAPIPTGVYSFSVTASKIGMVGASVNIGNINIVVAPPQVQILSSKPNEGETINYHNLSFSWNGSAIGAASNQLEYSYKMDSQDWSNFSSQKSQTYTGLSEGSHQFDVKVRVIGGLENSVPTSRSFIVDTLAPVIETTPIMNSTFYQNGDQISVQLDLDGEANVTAGFNRIDSLFSPGQVSVIETNPTSHIYTITYTISENNSNPDNSYPLTLYAVDNAGNSTADSSQLIQLDNFSPFIVDHEPLSGATDIALDSNVFTYFNEPINKTSAQSGFSISPSVSGSFSWFGNSLVFNPENNLLCETNYTIQLNSTVVDLVGKPLSPISWSFITKKCPSAEMDITGNNISIQNGDLSPSSSDFTDFGSIPVSNGSQTYTYTILNTGDKELNLNGSPTVTISGENAADFTVTSMPASLIEPGGSSTVTVTFDPSEKGIRTANISIENDDPDENPYNFAIQGKGNPERLLVGINTDYVEGYNWPLGANMTLTIDDPATPAAVDYTASASMIESTWNPDGGAWVIFNFSGIFDVKPGDIVRLTDGTTTKEHAVAALSVTEVDAETDKVKGTGVPGMTLDVYSTNVGRQVTVESNGTWTADYSGDLDLVEGLTGDVQFHEEDLDGTRFVWKVMNPKVQVGLNTDYVKGRGWYPTTWVTLTIDDPTTPAPVDYTESGITSDAPWNTNLSWIRFDLSGKFDVKPGDVVKLTDGVYTRQHTAVNISVEDIDVDLDTVTGTAPAGMPLYVYVDQAQSAVPVTSGENGHWVANFAGSVDLLPGFTGDVQYQDLQGETRVTWEAEEYLKPPTLVSPINNAFLNYSKPQFTWSNAKNAIGYILRYDTEPGFIQPFLVTTPLLSTTNHTPALALPAGKYYWQVRSQDSSGVLSDWSGIRTFTIALTPPNKPILEAPVNNSAINSTPKFYWLEPTFAESYEFQYDDDATFISPLYTSPELDEFAFTPPDIPVGKYYWHVRARDAAGNWGQWSSAFSFTIDITAPSAPLLNYPADLAFTSDTTPSLSVKPVVDAVRYRYQVSPVEDFSLILVDSTVKTILFSPPSTQALDYGLFYWRTSAFDSASNESAFSAPWRFFITNLSSPKDGTSTTNVSPTFVWISVTGANEYQLQVDNDADFSSVEVDHSQASGTTFTAPILCNGMHYWRMRVQTGTGWSSWTPTWKFFVISPLPNAPILVSPQNGYLTNIQSPTFTWNGVENGNWYHIQIGKNSDFSSPEQDTVINVGELSYLPSPLSEGTYYWRVSALNADGNQGAWSSSRSLTIDITAPLPPELSMPVNNAPNIRVTPTFYWLASNTATRYRFEYGTTAEIQTSLYSSPEISTISHTPPSMNLGTYFWHVQAGDVAGNWSSWSPSHAISIIPPIPSKPVLLTPANNSSISSRSTAFSWNPVDNATSYQIMVDDSLTFDSPYIDEMTNEISLERSFSSSGTYYWRVLAHNSVGESGGWSSSNRFTLTVPPLTPPNPPENLSATEIEQNQLKLTWEDKSTNETSFSIERSQSAGQWEKINSVDQNITTFTDTGLTCHTEYQYRVSAYNSNDNLYSTYSNQINITTLDCPPVDPPAIPTSLTSMAISNSIIELGWENTDSSVSSFHIERSLDGIVWEEIVETPSNTTTYQVNSLTINTLYYFRIRAYREIDTTFSEYSDIASATTKATIFEDDFSTDKGWVDQSDGAMHRDSSNQWLVWSVSRDTTHRYYIPIEANPGFIRLDLRFNATSFNGNGSIAFGLAENLDAPVKAIEVDATGFFTRIFCYDWKYWAHPMAIFQDGTSYVTPIENWINFSSMNTWYRLQIEINQNSWKYALLDDAGNQLGQLSGLLTQQHSGYNYLLLVFDAVGGWESSTGLIDNIQVYDLSSMASLSGTSAQIKMIPLEITSIPTPVVKELPTETPVPSPIPTNTPPVALEAPSNLSARSIDINSLVLNWEQYKESNNIEIHIERSSNGENDWTDIGSVAANISQFQDVGLSCESRYYYRIYSTNTENGLISPYSNIVEYDVPSCLPDPTATQELPEPTPTQEPEKIEPTFENTPTPLFERTLTPAPSEGLP